MSLTASLARVNPPLQHRVNQPEIVSVVRLCLEPRGGTDEVRYRVALSQAERSKLTALLSDGKHSARMLKRAQILMAADAGASDEEIAISVGVGGSTGYRTKRRFLVANLEEALSEEPRPGAPRKLSGKEEALLVATACCKPRRVVPVGPGAVGG